VPDPCADAGSEAVAWDEPLDFGDSAEQIFGGVEGSCEAPFVWDGEGAGTSIEPPRGESTVTVTVELDRQSVRVHRRLQRGVGTIGCEPTLTVDGHVSVRTEDGVFDDEADVTLTYGERTGLGTISYVVELQDLGGTLSAELGERERGGLFYESSGADSACAGRILLGFESSRGGETTSSIGRFASWSSSGCPLRETPFDPHAPGPDGGPSAADQITELWGDVSYPGQWDDDSATALELSVEVPATDSCRESGGHATVPVRVTYGTTDGRIESHAADAYVNVGLDVALALNIDETMRCDDTVDPLPYTLRGCHQLETVNLQLLINYDRGELDVTQGLTAYEYHRGGLGMGQADTTRILRLFPGN
jgi:hypothetical protein